MFTVTDHGSVVLVEPLTSDCRNWLSLHTDGMWFGHALVVEPRYLADLVSAMIEEGFAAS